MEINVQEASDDNSGWTRVSYRKKRKHVKRETSPPIHYAIIFAHSDESNLFKFIAVSRNPVGSLIPSTTIEEGFDDRIIMNTGLYDLEYIGRYEFNSKTFYHIYIHNYQLYLPSLENFRWMARGEVIDYRGIYDEIGILIPERYPSWIQNNFPPPIQNWIHNMRTNYVFEKREIESSDENDKNSHERPDHPDKD